MRDTRDPSNTPNPGPIPGIAPSARVVQAVLLVCAAGRCPRCRLR